MRSVAIAAALISLNMAESHACTNLIVTKGASADGSVMLSYSADSWVRYGTLNFNPAASHKAGSTTPIREWANSSFKYLGELPQVPYTYNVIGNMNEYQVAIGETTWTGIPQCRDTVCSLMDYGSLEYIALQRAKTAREAILIFTSLAEEYGYYSTGESISFVDKNEAWIMDITGKIPLYKDGENLRRGAVWVAMRIPDGCISGHANNARITTFPLNDPENCLYSKDLFDHVKETGLYDGPAEEFSFADTFCPLNNSLTTRCDRRVWSFFRRHGAEDMDKYHDYICGENNSNRIPLYVKVKEKVSMKELADMMRDHYEGTEFDMTKGVAAVDTERPYRWSPASFELDGMKIYNTRPICVQQTGFWFVAQCRDWLPDEIGGLFWFAVDDAGTSALTPIYSSSRRISEHYAFGNGSMLEYSPTSMFWLQNRIAQFAYLRYNRIGKEVRSIIDDHEKSMIELVAATDRQASELYGEGKKSGAKRAVKYVTDFSVNQADQLFDKWQKLDIYLLMKYMDGTQKKQNEEGAFVSRKDVPFVPVAPDYPGYSDEFKRYLRNEAGRK